MKRIVVKVGTNVITKESGLLDLNSMQNLVDQMVVMKRQGIEVVLISSGAVAAGRPKVPVQRLPDNAVSRRQILAAVGQVELMAIYGALFGKEGYSCAQVLATKEDFRDRHHYLCMRDCLATLLHDDIFPVVNENDVIAISELMFTDNDELAGLVASMIDADGLLILSSVDGLYDRNPEHPDAQLISVVDEQTGDLGCYADPEGPRSSFGRGGMHTKCRVARKMAQLGITTILANGKKEGILLDLIKGEQCGTLFLASKKQKAVKKWIAQGAGSEKGSVLINASAVESLRSRDRARSLLPVGIVELKGEWNKGDLICIRGPKGEKVGYGLAEYSDKTARAHLGKKRCKPVVHYDYLYVSLGGE